MNADLIGDERTIVALSTPLGRGALAVVRLSGDAVRTIAEKLLLPVPSTLRRATRCTVCAYDGSTIDEVIAVLYEAPHSFTGEDLLEITTHGGAIAPTMVVAAAIEAGARPAAPGEFTRRAVLNGKLDLLQAEAIGDLIDARSSAAHKLALRQLDGGLSRRIGELREQLLLLEAQIAYDIDFPEEDDGPLPREHILSSAERVIEALEALLLSGDQGALIHDGALVVLAGAPNVGKSSLFNALLGEARAIVTEIPGTTRDAIEAVLDLPQWPLRLVDTAGLRETTDLVEGLGIEASSRYLRRAHVVLACVDADDGLHIVDKLRSYTNAPIIAVRTKSDLVADREYHGADALVSANTGEGLRSLLQLVEDQLSKAHGSLSPDAPLLVRVRHQVAIRSATEEMRQFLAAWSEELLPASVAATHIHEAVSALSTLIGSVKTDDILDVVFRSFCVGK
jgi:tRNA modification GTPase